MAASAVEHVTYEQRETIGILTFNRPERLNAISGGMIGRSVELIDRLTRERSVRALIVTGAGRGFCSGADLSGDRRAGDKPLEDAGDDLADAMRRGLNPLLVKMTQAPFPIVTALNGPAAGAGVGLALAGDFLIAAQSSKLLLTFSKIGMGLDAGTSWFLPRLLGEKQAMAVCMLAEPLNATDLLEQGIAHSVVADEDLFSHALGLARQIAQGAPLAYAQIKQQLRRGLETTLEEALDAEADVQGALIKTNDMREGVSAFREKRPPVFRGD